ncbi:hypothetical protein BKA67DRAFT_660426 [Truncatella angustata]|uniref:Histone chaperone domain-containing protein n=1 Tax=Truncatella angustata TaxID=152316 RepID=A0A9P8ZV25_9PEZI|nr:uncharacterized protein BKA67DRAFT_660426 [Truncatella angustata]KAH6651631.1 hypothetical protein BKA67DRAFT_660426 [Truncatella angustata]
MSSYAQETNEVPSDNSYVSRQGHKSEPLGVVSDETNVEDPIDANTADSDAQLERDDREAISKDNIIDERTRGAKPQSGYQEPGDTEGLPEDSGKSAVAQ